MTNKSKREKTTEKLELPQVMLKVIFLMLPPWELILKKKLRKMQVSKILLKISNSVLFGSMVKSLVKLPGNGASDLVSKIKVNSSMVSNSTDKL